MIGWIAFTYIAAFNCLISIDVDLRYNCQHQHPIATLNQLLLPHHVSILQELPLMAARSQRNSFRSPPGQLQHRAKGPRLLGKVFSRMKSEKKNCRGEVKKRLCHRSRDSSRGEKVSGPHVAASHLFSNVERNELSSLLIRVLLPCGVQAAASSSSTWVGVGLQTHCRFESCESYMYLKFDFDTVPPCPSLGWISTSNSMLNVNGSACCKYGNGAGSCS